MNRSTKRWTRLLGVATVVIAVPSLAFASTPFEDVPPGAFYTEAVEWAFDRGITTGTTATTFSPNDPVTRGQSVTFLSRYHHTVVEPTLDRFVEEADVADVVRHGEIVLAHSGQSLVPFVGTDSFDYALRGASVRGGAGVLPLDGPVSVDGTAYGLESIEYCIFPGVLGAVTQVTVYASFDGDIEILASDTTDRNVPGCHRIDVGSSVERGLFLLVTFNEFTTSFEGATSTWLPVDQLG